MESRSRLGIRIVGLVVLLAVAFLAGRLSSADARDAVGGSLQPGPLPETAVTSPESPVERARRVSRLVRNTPSFATRDAALMVVADGGTAQGAVSDLPARRALGTLLRTLQFEVRRQGDDPPLAEADNHGAYVDGWLSGIMQVLPDAPEYLREPIADALCDEPVNRVETLLLLQVVSSVRSAVSSRAIDCVLTRFPEEGRVQWKALSLWRAAGLPRTSTIDGVEARAQHPATKRAFITNPEVTPERARAMAGASAGE